jgi:type II secretory pathway pseudopilin PulG
MRALRLGIVALIVIGLAASAFAGDLQQSIDKAAQQQPQQQQQRAPSKGTSKALVWAGSALFVGGMTLGLYSFINNTNGGFAEFGEANAVNKKVGAAGLATAFGGGVLMFLGSHQSKSPSVTVGAGGVKVSKHISW